MLDAYKSEASSDVSLSTIAHDTLGREKNAFFIGSEEAGKTLFQGIVF